MDTTNILIADDHEVVRRGVKDLLEDRADFKVCGEAATGREALSKAKLLKPDVVVLDITMPGLNAFETTRQIVAALPRTEVLVLTVHESNQIVKEILSAGAHGYVLKSDAGKDLIAAIDSLTQHRPYFTSKIALSVLKGYLASSKSPKEIEHDGLSPREYEVLELIAEGHGNKEIAKALGISIKTVQAHRTNTMRKLQVHSACELIRYAIRHNIIAP